MWIFLWVVLSLFVLGVFAWSMFILQEQKKAWYNFAKKTGLTYKAGKFTDAPIVTGMVKQHKVTFFTDSLRTQDIRGRRFVTTIEIEMGSGMATTAVLATPDYSDFLAPLQFPQTYQPAGPWNAAYIVKTRNKDVLASYLTPERAKIINSLFSTKGLSSIFFFDPQDSILRIETPDPLRQADRLENLARRVYLVADGLTLTPQEKQAAGLADQPADMKAAPGEAQK
jgi:hypothetical protein